MNKTMQQFMQKQNSDLQEFARNFAQATKEEVAMNMEVCFRKMVEKLDEFKEWLFDTIKPHPKDIILVKFSYFDLVSDNFCFLYNFFISVTLFK